MALFKDWQDFADKKSAEPGAEQYWTQYFLREKDFYEKLLKGEAPKSGTVQALADHFGVDIIEMTGYLDGINESLKAENDLENMTAETEVSLDYEPEKLYYNMVGAKAEWLYKLPQWDSILTEEKRKELYAQIQQGFASEGIFIPLLNTPWNNALRNDVTGWIQTPLGNFRFDELAKA